ncbi:MAG: STT3 domain-containing protein [Candidatus Bathyarchaeia archaeon]
MLRPDERSARTSTRGNTGEIFSSKLKAIKDYLATIPRGSALEALTLALILLIGLTVRLLPLRWGFYLSEFDPYQQYRLAEHIVDHGFYSWFTWHDNMSWHPWGRDTATTNYAGVPFTAAILYGFIRSIGFNVPLYDLCVLFPVVFGAVTCVAIYFLARELRGGVVGLFSALFLALSASHISRTSLGFFDDESIGIFTMILVFLFYLRAISQERPLRATLIYSIITGLGVAYLSASWGASRYVIALLALFTFVLTLMKRSSPRLLFAYAVTMGLGYLLMGQIPFLGYGFFMEWVTAAVLGVFLILLGVECSKRFKGFKFKVTSLTVAGLIVAAALILLWREGYITQLSGKFLTVLNPSTRFEMPLVESVAEHRPATWASFFYESGIYLFLGMFGFYFLTRRMGEGDLLLILLGVTSFYFAASLVRLTLILAPFLAVTSAVALGELCKPAVDIVRGVGVLPKRRMALPGRVGKEFGVSILLITLIITTPTLYYSVQAAYAPTTIATSSIPVAPTGSDARRYQDWMHALMWMKENLPEDAVVFSWWDYGYWITAIADKRSLADNGTINSTQIAVIAVTFLSNESQAVPILKRYNVTHVAIFATWTKDESGTVKFYGYGEDNKWYWMAKIGNGTTVNGVKYNFYQRTVGENTVFYRTLTVNGEVVSNNTITDPNGLNDVTMLGKLIQMGINPVGATSDYFRNVFSSVNRFVFIYEVNYLKKAVIDFELDKSSMVFGESVKSMGRLYDEEERVALEGRQVTIEYSMNRGETWNELVTVETQVNGTFLASWGLNVGSYLVRARWPGEGGKYLEALSQLIGLNVTVANVTLTCTLSHEQVKAGSSVNVSGILSKPLNTGNLTIQYSLNGEEWLNLAGGPPVNGSFTAEWEPPASGEYYIRAVWSGDYNHTPAVSEARKLTAT